MNVIRSACSSLALAALMLVPAGFAMGETVTVEVNKVSADGVGASIGTIVAKDVDGGVEITANLKELPAGTRGFHVHEKGDCGPGVGADGKPGAALAAGGHYDPHKTGKHMGPEKGGHAGDLPPLEAKEDGTVNQTMVVKGITVNDIKNRSFMVHAGGDNFSDQPAPLGGGGARIACGVIK